MVAQSQRARALARGRGCVVAARSVGGRSTSWSSMLSRVDVSIYWMDGMCVRTTAVVCYSANGMDRDGICESGVWPERDSGVESRRESEREMGLARDGLAYGTHVCLFETLLGACWCERCERCGRCHFRTVGSDSCGGSVDAACVRRRAYAGGHAALSSVGWWCRGWKGVSSV